MPEKILVCVAWPYCNGDLHIGHIAGAYLPPDIFARYHRLKGNEALMVSGSDTHGTPITVRAEEEGITPREVVDRYHPRFLELFQRLGIAFDLFTETDTENHWAVTQDMFLRHLEREYIYKDIQQALYCNHHHGFLADRYVEGTCPYCDYEGARGDQCDNCGRTLDAIELKNPRCKVCGSTEIIVRETEHFFLDLAKLNGPLLEWIRRDKEHWRPSVLNFTRAQLESGELRGRPITRDIQWGIPIPLPGYESKRIYVWYDAVIGYLSATKEWAKITGQPDAWREWWETDIAPDVKSYYFIGKDNIPFHTIIWPGMLYAYGGLNLPYDVPANEYLNVEGAKLSKSRRWVIEVLDVLDRYDPDPWRYILTINAPETSDVNFTWEEFVRRNNTELVATWGNLANRVLSFAYRRFDGRVPQPGDLDEIDQALLNTVKDGFDSVGRQIEGCHFKAALTEAMGLAQEANRYLNVKEPWKQIKEDPAAAATTIYVCLQAIDWLRVIFSPFLPFSSQKLHEYLGHEGSIFGRQYVEEYHETERSHLALRYDRSDLAARWAADPLPPGQPLRLPQPLFRKLDESVAEEEVERLLAKSGTPTH
ncbi:MAG: methionine--tRNA ligase [Chloroflexi bacterium]|nr:methionine--tRNA ligase [Chloroflexota bacterium]